MSNIQYTGIRSAIVTPLDANGDVAVELVKPIVDFAIEKGVEGFYVCGSTGEGPLLGAKDRMIMTEAVIKACEGKKSVTGKKVDTIIHVGAPNPKDAFELAKHAKAVGADCLSSLAPNFYFSFGPDEMLNYYKRLADCTDLPILAYVTPMLGKVSLKDFFTEMLKIDHVIGCKYTLRDYEGLDRLKSINNGDINVINGPDETLLAGLVMGADGGIGTTYNIIPGWFVDIYNLYKAGKLEEARLLQQNVNNVISTIYNAGCGYVNTCKAVLGAMGMNAGKSVHPAKDVPADVLADVVKKLKGFGVEI